TVAVTWLFARRVWGRDQYRASVVAVATLAAVVVVRQTMEIGSGLETAAIELRLFDPTMMILGALLVGGAVAWAMRRLSVRLPDRELTAATRAFAVIFFVQ